MEQYDVVIIGGSQAGLGLGYYLRKSNLRYVILDSSMQVGDSWKSRWDSLTLFTPRFFSRLPGKSQLLTSTNYRITKDDVAHYLASYAKFYTLPVQTGTQIISLTRGKTSFVITTNNSVIIAKQVVVATGAFNQKYLPPIMAAKTTGIHSSQYKNPVSSLTPGLPVVIVGSGNTGAQIAIEIAATHPVTIVASGKQSFVPTRIIGINIFWWFKLLGVLSAQRQSRIGRFIRAHGDMIIGTDLKRFVRHSQIKVARGRVTALTKDNLQLDTGDLIPFGQIIWATGFRPDYSWIDIPGTVSPEGFPVQSAGKAPTPGMYWLGVPWQRNFSSAIMYGIRSDAQKLADDITAYSAAQK